MLSEGGQSSKMPDVLRSPKGLRTFVGVSPIGETEVDKALNVGWTDPEDALVFESALRVGADVIVTRDQKDFESDAVRAMDCEGLFAWLEEEFGIAYEEMNI